MGTPGMAWRWQVFGLTGELDSVEVEFLLTQASRSVRGAVLVRAFVPACRCGAVPESHRVPFRRPIHGNATSYNRNIWCGRRHVKLNVVGRCRDDCFLGRAPLRNRWLNESLAHANHSNKPLYIAMPTAAFIPIFSRACTSRWLRIPPAESG